MSHGIVHDRAQLPPPSLEEVSPGIFAYIQLDGTWFLNNAGFIVGNDAVTVVDTTGTEKRAHAFHESVKKTTSKPIHALVNTHSHADHTHGNFMFSSECVIIGHERCREEILRGSLEAIKAAFPTGDFGDVPYVAPNLTFTDRLTLWIDDLKVELIHVGPAHTTNDVVVWLPDRKVLFSGDLVFNGGTPFAMAGSVTGWLEALDVLRGLGAETIVPGHGPVCGPDVFDDIGAYLGFVQEVAGNGFAEGIPPLEMAKATNLGDFGALSDPERIAGNLHRAYSELRGEPRGAPLDIPAVFADMVAYNGGNPLRCLA